MNPFKFLLPCLLLLPDLVLAQKADTVVTYEPAIPKKDRLIVELGHANWLHQPQGIETRPYSYDIGIYYCYEIGFGESPFGVATGLGFSSHNVHHNGYFSRNFQEGTLLKPYLGAEPDLNKLSTNYIDVPVELRFRTRHEHPFRITAGFRAGYLVNVHTKTKDGDNKWKHYQVPDLLPYRYGIHARIGYGFINLHGYYALSTLLESGKGPGLIPFTAGLSFTFF